MDAHSCFARNLAHLYVVGGRQHSMDAVAEMQSNNIAAYCFTLDLDELHEGYAQGNRLYRKH